MASLRGDEVLMKLIQRSVTSLGTGDDIHRFGGLGNRLDWVSLLPCPRTFDAKAPGRLDGLLALSCWWISAKERVIPPPTPLISDCLKTPQSPAFVVCF